MFPIINIGPVAIQASGLILLLSLFIGTWLAGKFALSLGTHAEGIENSILFGLIAGIVGARIGFFLVNPAILRNDPLSIISLSPSMLDASFGLLVGTLTAVILGQKKNLPLWPTLDTLTPLFLLLFIGLHLANYANGNAYGIPTDLPWGIDLWNAVRHPVQLYAIILASGLLGGLLFHTRMLKSTGFQRSGVLFLVTLAGLALITLVIQAFIAEKTLFGSIDIVQIFAFMLLLASLGLIYSRVFPARAKESVLISMGSNQNPHQQLNKAEDLIASKFRIRQKSSRYQTQDILGNPAASDFLNQVIEIETDLSYISLSAELKAIEQSLGRVPGNKKEVALDLDILTYGQEVFSDGLHRIPAPDMIKYRYIALPLAEMSPGFRHPANGQTFQEILDHISDETQVIFSNEVENGIEG
jgi:phosphatidylglycerol---prolipoprotein diacylglyceryl transferase